MRARMGLKILVADEEEELIAVMQARLEAYGFTELTLCKMQIQRRWPEESLPLA